LKRCHERLSYSSSSCCVEGLSACYRQHLLPFDTSRYFEMWKKLRTFAFVAILLLTIATTRQSSTSVVTAVEAAVRGDTTKTTGDRDILKNLKSHYDDLSPRGKVVTGAAVGFIGSRLALGTVTKVVKWGAGAFIV
jgi:hypothetical protein